MEGQDHISEALLKGSDWLTQIKLIPHDNLP